MSEVGGYALESEAAYQRAQPIENPYLPTPHHYLPQFQKQLLTSSREKFWTGAEYSYIFSQAPKVAWILHYLTDLCRITKMAELTSEVVSLGVQVCLGINNYIDTLKSRDAEISAVKKDTEELEGTFQSIKSIMTQEGMTAQLSKANVIHCLETCFAEMKSLDELGTELLGRPLSTIPGVRGKAENILKHLGYPIRRSGIMRLREQLGRSVMRLQLTMQTIDL